MGSLVESGTSAVQDESRPSSSRLVLVDFARAVAVLFMIQGHTLDVLLAPNYRQGALFESWLFLRGLTAPMFFTLSGISFALSGIRRWDAYSRPSPAFFRRLGRFAFFICLGYLMHLPVKSFHDFRYLDAAGWQGWLQVDVLQCIGFTLIFLQLSLLFAPSPEIFAGLAAASSACVVLISPVVWDANAAGHVPPAIASYLNARTGSLFPLFPWSGYVFFGAALGYLFAQRWSGSSHSAGRPLAIVGIPLIFAGLCFAGFPVTLYRNIEFWKVSPNLFLIRVGSVCCLLALLAYLTRRIAIPQRAARSLAQESLTVYFVHVCLLYGSIWNVGLRQTIGANLAPLPTLGWACVLLVSMTLLGLSWNWHKKAAPMANRLVRTAIVVAIAYGLS